MLADAPPDPRRTLTTVYALGLGALAVLLQVITPIIAFDTDLWYHLSHGRTVVESGEIPTTSYFSYLDPPRSWVDYYWGFQVLAYGAFEMAGYWGLLVLRGLGFAALLGIVGSWLGISKASGWRLVLWAALIVQFFPKAQLVRPHAASYLCIALFLWILEQRRSWMPALPLVAWGWVNLHGVEYPILLVIIAAYGVEAVVRRRKTENLHRELAVYLLCLVAIFLTPHGARLLSVPFRSTELASQYLTELARPELWELFSLSVSPHTVPTLTVVSFFFVASLLCAVGSLRRGQAFAPLLLWVAGCALLLRGFRFHHEFTLLSLPLLLSQGPPILLSPRLAVRRMADLGVLLCCALPLVALLPRTSQMAESFPLSLRNLPHGAARFLVEHGAGGRVMNPPNFGGYLQWELGEDFRIFMDMEVPFLFSDLDIYEVSAAFVDSPALAHVLARDRPTFIAAPRQPDDFSRLAREHPRYVPVFFDDLVVVYADQQQRPELVSRFRLQALDPYALEQKSLSELPAEQKAAWQLELERVAGIDGRIVAVNQALAILYLQSGDLPRAEARVLAILDRDRRIARGWQLRGDWFRSSGQLAEALAAYRKALRLSTEEVEERSISRSMASLLDEMQRPEKAYRALLRAVGSFDPHASCVDLYNLGILAARTGRLEDAHRLLTWASLKAPPDQTIWEERVRSALRSLETPESAP